MYENCREKNINSESGHCIDVIDDQDNCDYKKEVVNSTDSVALT